MKLPRDLSGRDVAKALCRLGFVSDGQRGSHMFFRKEGLRVTVPNHRAILPKTLQSLLRQASVSLEEFLAKI
ncbi:MAG: type II toxin-antitoxin system HicA family toxin [Verrucomicrobiae bacterium]|nr:type II toxin-antitoxin system HicA family toxin [Verrucomicrobiae bacterium]